MHISGFRRTLTSAGAKWWIQSSCVCDWLGVSERMSFSYPPNQPTYRRLRCLRSRSMLASLPYFPFLLSRFHQLLPSLSLLEFPPEASWPLLDFSLVKFRKVSYSFSVTNQAYSTSIHFMHARPRTNTKGTGSRPCSFFGCLKVLGDFWKRLLEEYSIVDPVVPEQGEKLGGLRVWRILCFVDRASFYNLFQMKPTRCTLLLSIFI